jgi:ABC-type nitrate/sulfonate/bicarbonate transport system substrate-binding protein
MQTMRAATSTSSRLRRRLRPRQAAVAAAAAAAVALAGSGCSSTAKIPTVAGQHRQQGLAAGRALAVGHGPDRIVRLPQVRLGLIPDATDAAALAGLQLGYFSQQLGGHEQLDLRSYASGQAEAAALASGALDAAYIDPVAAIAAWQASARNIRIMSGASSNNHGTRASTVLVMSQKFLTAHPTQVEALLQAQVRANGLINTNEILARSAASTELATLLGRRPSPRHLAQDLAGLTFTNNPLSASVIDQARHAATAAGHAPGQHLKDIFDLAMLNQILRTSGETAVPG